MTNAELLFRRKIEFGILGIGLVMISLSSCAHQIIELDYCKMIFEEQSYVNSDKSVMQRYLSGQKARHQIFEQISNCY